MSGATVSSQERVVRYGQLAALSPSVRGDYVLHADYQRLHDLLHQDQTGLAHGLYDVLKVVAGFRWAQEGRGAYEWDDDRFHDEMRNMLNAVQAAAQKAIDNWQRGPLPCCAMERQR